MGDAEKMNDKVYWVWAQDALGISASVKTDEIVSYFGTAKKLYLAGEYEWKISGIFTNGQIRKLKSTALDNAEKIVAECDRYRIKIVTPEDDGYPSMLFKLPNLPLVLYVRGDLDCLKNKITVAMVGAREASDIGVRIARSLSASLSRSGAVVISGAARGIDSAAHTGALNAGAKTVAVLGCGFGTNYLPENEALRREIAHHGALVTEYPPRTPALGRNFPFRNRIISGLSYGTIVIEANEKSGSLRTVNHAIEQGRDIFAVPGDITSSMNMGTNKLLRDGAKPVFNAMDVLEEYAERYPDLLDMKKIETVLKMDQTPMNTSEKVEKKEQTENKKKTAFVKPTASKGISDTAKLVFDSFTQETMQAEELILKTGLSTVDFLSAMTELEILRYVEPLAGKNYKITAE